MLHEQKTLASLSFQNLFDTENDFSDESKEMYFQAVTHLSKIMRWQENENLQSWSERLLQYLVRYTKGVQGSLYYLDTAEEKLIYTGGFCIDIERNVPKSIPLGSGLMGQAAKDQKALIVLEEGRFQTLTSRKLNTNASLIVLPLVYNYLTRGVIEIAFSEKPSPAKVDIIQLLAESIAASLNALIKEQELKQSLEQLREIQDRLRRFAGVTSEGIVFVDSNRQVSEANNAFIQLVGYSLEEIQEMQFVDLLVNKNITPHELEWNITRPIPYETKIRRANGTEIHVEIQARTTTFEGQILHIVSFRDISKRVETEHNLKKSQEQLAEAQKIVELTALISEEREKADDLLKNILPAQVAQELKEKGYATPKLYQQATIMFTDFKGFTQISEKLTPEELIRELGHCFSTFDEICNRHHLEKIKTIGDAYMCVGGVPTPNETNALDAVKAALDIRSFMQQFLAEKKNKGEPLWQLRIGIHTGQVVAGVIGKNKFAYDIWGDAVNLASRMETSGEVGKVNISEKTYQLVKNAAKCTYRGKLEAKNKGFINMYFVEDLIV